MKRLTVPTISSTLLVGLVLATSAFGQDCLDYGQHSRRVGGYYTSWYIGEDVLVVNDRIYYCWNIGGQYPPPPSSLVVVDASDPSDPEILATVPIDGWVFTVVDDFAYVASDTLTVVDISDPTTPVTVGTLDISGTGSDVAVAGGLAYVGCYGGGYQLLIVDVSNPAAPDSIGSVDMPGGVGDVVVSGDHAYVGCGSNGLQIVDVSDPTQPAIAGSCNVTAGRLAVTAGYAYLPWWDGLRVVDVSDPSDPTIVTTLDIPALDVAIADGYAFLPDSPQIDWYCHTRLSVLDISDPASPAMLYRVPTGAAGMGVAAADGYVYVLGITHVPYHLGALDIIEITCLAPAGAISAVATSGHATDLAVSGNFAYMTFGGPDALRIVDCSDPLAPVFLGSVDTPLEPIAVAVAGNLACVTDQRPGNSGNLHVVDVTDPDAPEIVGSVETWANDVAMTGSAGAHAYVVGGPDGLQIFDLSEPSTPLLVGSVGFGLWPFGAATDLALDRDKAYVATTYCDPNGLCSVSLHVVDVSDLTMPVVLGETDVCHSAGYGYCTVDGIVVEGDFVYLATDGAFRVIDVSNPEDPHEVAQTWLPLCSDGGGLALAGHYAYALQNGLLHVVDVSSPTAPAYIGAADPGGAVGAGVAADSSCVYVALQGWESEEPDFTVFPRQCPPAPVGLQPPPTTHVPARVLATDPNPFSSTTRLSFDLPVAGRVSLEIFDPSGRLVTTHDLGWLDAGRHGTDFDGRLGTGRPLSPGVWFVRLRMPEGTSEPAKLMKVR